MDDKIITWREPKPEDSALTINAGDRKLVVTIRYDGSVEFGEGYGPDLETAKTFWRIVAECLPGLINFKLATRPVAFRVRCVPNEDAWFLFDKEQDAAGNAEARNTEYQGLYARDGS